MYVFILCALLLDYHMLNLSLDFWYVMLWIESHDDEVWKGLSRTRISRQSEGVEI